MKKSKERLAKLADFIAGYTGTNRYPDPIHVITVNSVGDGWERKSSLFLYWVFSHLPTIFPDDLIWVDDNKPAYRNDMKINGVTAVCMYLELDLQQLCHLFAICEQQTDKWGGVKVTENITRRLMARHIREFIAAEYPSEVE